jgi:hypothetical protein
VKFEVEDSEIGQATTRSTSAKKSGYLVSLKDIDPFYAGLKGSSYRTCQFCTFSPDGTMIVNLITVSKTQH